MSARIEKWRCAICSEIATGAELLRAPSPFDPEDELCGCPHCKSAEGFAEICEIGDCEREATCGGPSLDGVYRRTCGAHADWIRK